MSRIRPSRYDAPLGSAPLPSSRGANGTQRAGMILICVSTVGLLWLGWLGAARAERTVSPRVVAVSSSTALQERLRGSGVNVRNIASAGSLDRGLGQTYDPFVGMTLELSPRFWLGDSVYTRAQLALAREWTDANQTTLAKDTQWGDLGLAVGAPGLWRIPGLGLDLSLEWTATLPTSLAARAQTLELALTNTVALSRLFGVLGGLTVQVGSSVTKFFHRFTTGENTGPRYPGCGGLFGGRSAATSCLSTGIRNSSSRWVTSAGVELALGNHLALAFNGALVHDFLYPQGALVLDAANGHGGGPGVRYGMATATEVVARTGPVLAFALGMVTETEQLHSSPSARFRQPVFDPFRTAFFFDVRIAIPPPEPVQTARL